MAAEPAPARQSRALLGRISSVPPVARIARRGLLSPTLSSKGGVSGVAQRRRRSADFSPQRSAHRKDAAECSWGGGTLERCCGLKSALRRLAWGTLNRYPLLEERVGERRPFVQAAKSW